MISVLGYAVDRDLMLFGVLPYLEKRLEITADGERRARSARGVADLRLFGRYACPATRSKRPPTASPVALLGPCGVNRERSCRSTPTGNRFGVCDVMKNIRANCRPPRPPAFKIRGLNRKPQASVRHPPPSAQPTRGCDMIVACLFLGGSEVREGSIEALAQERLSANTAPSAGQGVSHAQACRIVERQSADLSTPCVFKLTHYLRLDQLWESRPYLFNSPQLTLRE